MICYRDGAYTTTVLCRRGPVVTDATDAIDDVTCTGCLEEMASKVEAALSNDVHGTNDVNLVTCKVCINVLARCTEAALDEAIIKIGVSGTPGTAIPAGTQLQCSGGDWAIVTEDYIVGLDGEVEVEVRAAGAPPT